MDYDRCKESADYIQQRSSIMPQLGIICGSGLGKGVNFCMNFLASDIMGIMV